jgi:hypothetical protein
MLYNNRPSRRQSRSSLWQAKPNKVLQPSWLHEAHAKQPNQANAGNEFEDDDGAPYGMTLSQCNDQIVRKLELLINSYADACRMQILTCGGTSRAAAWSSHT